MSSPDLPRHERGISPHQITIQYGEATLRINYEEDDRINLINPSLTLSLGNFQETIPYRNQTGTFQVKVSKYLDNTKYSRKFNLVTYNLEDLQSRFGASAFLEEIQHESLNPIIDQLLTENKLPEFIRTFPHDSRGYLQKRRADLKARATEDYQRRTIDVKGASELLYIQELIAKKQTFQEMLQWSHGNLARIISPTPTSVTPEAIEKDYFEWLYLTLLATGHLNTRTLQGVLDWSSGVPFSISGFASDDDFNEAIATRFQFLETGLGEENSKVNPQKSWLPDDYKSTELYQYFISP